MQLVTSCDEGTEILRGAWGLGRSRVLGSQMAQDVRIGIGCRQDGERVRLETAASLTVWATVPCRWQRSLFGGSVRFTRTSIGPPQLPRMGAHRASQRVGQGFPSNPGISPCLLWWSKFDAFQCTKPPLSASL